METLCKNTVIDRCLEIEYEYDAIKPIRLLSSDVEDISDLYQEKLEQQWYKRELEDEYQSLNASIGYPNRRLYDKSLRRLK